MAYTFDAANRILLPAFIIDYDGNFAWNVFINLLTIYLMFS